MKREETLAHWKHIIDGYQSGTETVMEYCKRLNVSTRMYYHYRLAIYGPSRKSSPKESGSEETRLLPVVAARPEQTTVSVNHIQITYSDISDQELGRILRLCRDL